MPVREWRRRVPLVAVAVPAAEVVDAGEGGGGHARAEGGVVGELLQAVGEGDGVAWLDDEACDRHPRKDVRPRWRWWR